MLRLSSSSVLGKERNKIVKLTVVPQNNVLLLNVKLYWSSSSNKIRFMRGYYKTKAFHGVSNDRCSFTTKAMHKHNCRYSESN